VQLSHEFRLDAAASIVDYLDRLGVSHLYASPILEARAGSTHCYDVVNPTRLNPELGDDDALTALAADLRSRGMGILLDIVPNHMGTSNGNVYWMDILTHGRASQYAAWFDIDWDRPGRYRGRVVVPALDGGVESAVLSGDLRLVKDGGGVWLQYHDRRFPLAPEATPSPDELNRFGTDQRGRANLSALLDQQHYALIDWHLAAKYVNYRRFFDINDLIAVRVEDPAVFQATHARILSWIADGTVDGLRVDHVDGLQDPTGYLNRLRAEVQQRRQEHHVPIVVEKILSGAERLRPAWPVEGTTGYDFMDEVESIFIDASGFSAIDAFYRRSVIRNAHATFRDAAIRGKLEVLKSGLSPDVKRVARAFADDSKPGDATACAGDELRRSLVRLTAVLPVYRTYIPPSDPVTDEDRLLIDRSAADAATRWPQSGDQHDDCVHHVRNAMLDESPDHDRDFALRFQQASGAATAKGIEDTALYRYVPMVSLNEVGGTPDRPLDSAVLTLHQANEHRARHWPRGLLAASTHDSKHSADFRSRIDVLSEIPEEWCALVTRWHRLNREHRRATGTRLSPDFNTEYLLYQTLIGIWEPSADWPSLCGIADRVDSYMRKATREAGTRTSWIQPNTQFEDAVAAFIRSLILSDAGSAFRLELDALVERIGPAGCWNALARSVVHITAPGTPDLYQGDELWNFALVDPDNRRPVDYQLRRRLLGEIVDRTEAPAARADFCRELVSSPFDDRLKLHVIHSALQARRQDAQLFASGYVPLEVSGACKAHVFAFARTNQDRIAVVIVPRLAMTLAGGAAPVGAPVWKDTAVLLPSGIPSSTRFYNVFTGAELRAGSRIELALALDAFPAALLVFPSDSASAGSQVPPAAALLPA
jgi:(1->4)-alpha-D-glucan 1-alpha-D-glucosylmutase